MENIFDVNYNTKLDRLEIPKEKGKNKIFGFLKNNKLFSVVVTSFFVLSGINFYLIYRFIKILEHI